MPASAYHSAADTFSRTPIHRLILSTLLVFPFGNNAHAAWVDVGKSYQAFYMAAAPHVNRVYFFERNQKRLYYSTDNGITWTGLRATVTNGTVFDAGLMKIIFDPADTTDSTFWAGGIYGSSGIFHTTDGGQTFTATSFQHTQTFSIDLTDSERKTILATDHGGDLFLSTDGGVTCRSILANLTAADLNATKAMNPYIIDAGTFLVGGAGALWRSANNGMNWGKIDAHSPVQPLVISPVSGTFVYCLTYNRGLIHSTDQGATWLFTTPRVTFHAAPESHSSVFIGDSLVFIKMVPTTGTSGQLLVSTDYTNFSNFLDSFPTTGNNLPDQNYGVIYSKPGNMLYTYTRYGKISRWDLSETAVLRPALSHMAGNQRMIYRIVGDRESFVKDRAYWSNQAVMYDIQGRIAGTVTALSSGNLYIVKTMTKGR